METFSYIASFIATVLGLCEPFSKKMKTVLTLSFLGNFLVAMSYLLIGKVNGSLICFVACVQLIINYSYDVRDRRLPKWFIGLHVVAFLLVNIITFTYWYDILALLAAWMFVLSVAQPDAKYYRMYYMINSLIWIIYDLLAKAYGNLFTHVILAIAIFIAMRVRDAKKEHEKEGE